MDNCAELVVAVLAVLQAGGAYVPLDPELPRERLAGLLDDAAPRLVLTLQAWCARVPAAAAGRTLCLDDAGLQQALDRLPAHALDDAERRARPHPDHAAYLVFTSGSGGVPKAVVNTHRNVLRLFDPAATPLRWRDDDTWTMFHAASFDFSVWELWGALLHGGRLVLVPRPLARSPERFGTLLRQARVTVLSQTPAALARLLDGGLAEDLAVRILLLGGEPYGADLVAAWGARSPVHNVYGPTETSIFASMSDALAADAPPPLGAPVAHTQLLVLDG
jgi:pristinamycin I synthase-2